MQRNFSFFHTIDAVKCEILTNLEEFYISPHDRCAEIQNLLCFVVVKSVFVTNYAVFAKSVLARLTRFRVEKN